MTAPLRARAGRVLAGLDRSWRRPEVIAVLAALVPIVAAVLRHTGGRWIPVADNAIIEIRSRDVFSWRHVPLIGTRSSASQSSGVELSHPGPMLFALLAVPVRLFGGSSGMAIGVGAINASMVVGMAIVGHRLRGALGAVVVVLVAALLSFSLGSAMLTDPWNPHVLVLAALCLLVLTWGVAAGDVVLLPWLLAVGTLCVQTHIGYAYLVPVLSLTAIAGSAVVFRRRWRTDPAARLTDRARLARTAAWSVTTMAVLWAPPLIEQVAGEGEGNLSRIISSAGSDEPVVGARLGVRLLAAVVALPPWWSRSSFVETVVHTPYGPDGRTIAPAGLPGGPASVAGLAVVTLLLAGVVVLGILRRRRVAAVAGAVGLAGMAGAMVSLTLMPLGPLGLTPHQMRWLWALGAFVAVAVVFATVDHLVPPAPVAGRSWPLWAGVAMVAVVGLANVPRYVQPAGPDVPADALPVALELSAEVAAHPFVEPVYFDARGLRYLEPYSTVVLAALQRSGVEFTLDDPPLVRQLGEERRTDGTERTRLYIREGREALEVADGATLVAFSSPLSTAELDRLVLGEVDLVALLAAGVRLTPTGDELVDGGAFGMTRAEIETQFDDPREMVANGLAAEMIAAGGIELDAAVADEVRVTVELRRRVGTTTVAVLATDR